MKKALKTKERMSIVEAVDIFSSLAELSSKRSFSEGGFDRHDLHPSKWLDEDQIIENEELVKEALESMRHYLEQMHRKHLGQFADHQIQRGIFSMLEILKEGKEKLIQYTGLFAREEEPKGLLSVKEYTELMDCIESRITPNLPKKKQARIEEVEDVGADPYSQLKEEIEDLKLDGQYDLFYVKKDSGHAFYDQECIRKLKLLYDVEKMGEEDGHFLRNLHILEARDFQKRAVAILVGVESLSKEFYKVAAKMKSNTWSSSISKALMSLMLSATPHAIPEHGPIARTAVDYFIDFHTYLREALSSVEYVASTREDNLSGWEKKFSLLTHKLCFLYFTSISLEKSMISFFKELTHHTAIKGPVSEVIEHEDKTLRELLHKTPNGPIKKIVAAFLKGDLEEGWDPLDQGNTPSQAFTFSMQGRKVRALHMAAPICQNKVHQVKLVKEFAVFLGECARDNKKVLLIDLQDSTDFIEHERIQSLTEGVLSKASILRLAKQTDFYKQCQEYQNIQKVEDFFAAFEEQILIGGACGFAFPNSFTDKQLHRFCSDSFSYIHQTFFSTHKQLSVEERKNFIEIFYTFLVLKTIEIDRPDYIAFVSKDGLDTAVTLGAEVFFAMKMFFASHMLKEKDIDGIFWWLYAPVLLLRERVTHKREIERVTHFMQCIEAVVASGYAGWEKGFFSLFRKNLFQDVEISSN